jgi:hypothetical protein
MGAAKRDEVKKPHPAVTAALLLVVGLVLALFPVALYANAMAMIDGYRASHGQAGESGTATVESAVDTRGVQVCTGTFAPADGGPEVEVRIEVAGRCEVGQEAEVRLMEGRASPFIGYDQARAWAAESIDWAVYIPLVVLFGLLSLPFALLIAMLVTRLVKVGLRTDRAERY